MTHHDRQALGYELREVLGYFHNATAFETAVAAVEAAGTPRDAINMMASHDAVQDKLPQHFRQGAEIDTDLHRPQPIYWDRDEIAADQRIAVGLPVYIGGLGAGLAVVATGGTLALAALIAAGGAAAGAGLGTLLARYIGKHHAEFLAEQLAMGALAVTVEVADDRQEEHITTLLRENGAESVQVHRLEHVDLHGKRPLAEFDPFEYWRN